jgi:hypothetical protein
MSIQNAFSLALAFDLALKAESCQLVGLQTRAPPAATRAQRGILMDPNTIVLVSCIGFAAAVAVVTKWLSANPSVIYHHSHPRPVV